MYFIYKKRSALRTNDRAGPFFAVFPPPSVPALTIKIYKNVYFYIFYWGGAQFSQYIYI